MSEFRTLLLEGYFIPNTGDALQVNQKDAYEELLPFIGQEVQLAIHHLPPGQPDPSKPGLGSCYWSGGHCPAGHTANPQNLLSVNGQGILRCHDKRWYLDRFDGTQQEFPLQLLAGHHARIACATVFDVERMRDSLGDLDLDALGVKVEGLKEILERLKG